MATCGLTSAASHGCYRTLRSSEGTAEESIKKSLRHHPQGHNNTSSHAHDEVDTTLQLRRAATVCLLIPNLRFLLPAAKPFNPQPCVQAWANDLGNPTMKAPLPPKKTADWANSASVGLQTLREIYERLGHCVHIQWQFSIRPHPSCCWLVFM